jgi:hypothetical protein
MRASTQSINLGKNLIAFAALGVTIYKYKVAGVVVARDKTIIAKNS